MILKQGKKLLEILRMKKHFHLITNRIYLVIKAHLFSILIINIKMSLAFSIEYNRDFLGIMIILETNKQTIFTTIKIINNRNITNNYNRIKMRTLLRVEEVNILKN